MFPSTSNFCRETCKLMARAAQMAYSKASECEAMAREAGAIYFQWIEDRATDTQCFIAADFENLVISFRGSSSVRDWLADLKIRRTEWLGYRVHRGFVGALNGERGVAAANVRVLTQQNPTGVSVLARIARSLSREEFYGQRVYVAGHSLGGALALLTAFYLKRHDGRDVAGVYTFGQPRVGAVDFCEAYDLLLKDRTFRVTNEKDIVPRVPAWLSGYRHCGTEIFLDAFGALQFNPPWWRRVPSHLYSFALGLDVVMPISSTVAGPLKDHFTEAYLRRLEATI